MFFQCHGDLYNDLRYGALAAEDLDFAFLDPTYYACLSVSHMSVCAAAYPLACCR